MEQRVERIVRLLPDREGDRYWSAVSRLEALGKPAAGALVSRLDSDDDRVRLGCAKALVSVGSVDERDRALDALAELARDAKDRQVRIDAIQIWGLTSEDLDAVVESCEEMLADELDARVVISLARTLYEVDDNTTARDRLIELLRSQDIAVRQEAALTLAELGSGHAVVKTVLRHLKKEPTPRGRRAELLSRLMRLEREMEAKLLRGDLVGSEAELKRLVEIRNKRIAELEAAVKELEKGGGGKGGVHKNTVADRLLEEVIERVQAHYVDADKASRDRLLTSAVKGMVRSLDEHSLFMDAAQAKDFDEDIKGKYAGIGAQISKPSGSPLEILRPIYGGPADEAGLLSGDLVLDVDGRPTSDMKLDELRSALRGKAGATVELQVLRRGWMKPRSFEVRRAFVKLPSVYWESLPNGIGYIRLTQFGSESYRDFETALETLEEGGMKRLVLDLRNNPGGLLRTAEKIADLFVRGERPIVTQKGRDGDEQATYPTEGAKRGYPVAVLVNGGSASASEVVSGCLQDYDRATIIGERTFGKGSVQRLIPIRTRKGSTLKLTVQYWHLPLDRCIDTVRDENGKIIERGGVQPDLVVAPFELQGWRLEERRSLRVHQRILAYVDEHFDALESLVPFGDRGAPTRYPEFAALYESLDTHATEDDVRQVIRAQVRRRVEDARHRQFPFDLQEDPQLQRAIVHLLEGGGGASSDWTDSEHWSWLAGRFGPDAAEEEKKEKEIPREK